MTESFIKLLSGNLSPLNTLVSLLAWPELPNYTRGAGEPTGGKVASELAQ